MKAKIGNKLATMKARHFTICKGCGATIVPGTLIKSYYGEWVHSECVTTIAKTKLGKKLKSKAVAEMGIVEAAVGAFERLEVIIEKSKLKQLKIQEALDRVGLSRAI